MEQVISNLLERYEGGTLSRRDLVRVLRSSLQRKGPRRSPDSTAPRLIMS